ncbi:MAG: glycoside hydrolase, partial [Ignavibacteria bacterium]|nr:glycoside hydrolase [Ignavibacteria bacterium]
MKIGLQWQWQANHDSSWYSLTRREGWLRLFPQRLLSNAINLYNAPFLLMQKFPADKFSATTKMELNNFEIGDRAGLIIFGYDYSFIGIEKSETGYNLSQIICNDADKKNPE